MEQGSCLITVAGFADLKKLTCQYRFQARWVQSDRGFRSFRSSGTIEAAGESMMNFEQGTCVGRWSCHAVSGLTGLECDEIRLKRPLGSMSSLSGRATRFLKRAQPSGLRVNAVPGRSRFARFRWAGLTAGLVVVLWAAGVEAMPIGTDWTAVSQTTAVGTLDGISVSVAGLARMVGSPLLISVRNLSGPPYSGAPLASAEVITYGGVSNWTATFGQAIPDLRLYLSFWRGFFGSASTDVFSYAFDQPFTVLSGLGEASISGNVLTLDDSPRHFHDGIIQFTGPISMVSVSVTSPALPFSSDQRFTFGTVPEPSTGLLTLLGLAALCRLGRRA